MKIQLNARTVLKVFLVMLTLLVVAAATFAISFKHTAIPFTDTHIHMNDAVEIVEGRAATSYPGWYIVFGLLYRLFHIPANYSAAIACAFFAVLTGSAIYFVLSRELGQNIFVNSFIVLFMVFYGPLHFKAFGDNYYLGQSSFNTWHNPTNPSVKFLAIIIFYFYIHYFHAEPRTSLDYFGGQLTKKKATILLSVFVFISLLCKPSFFQVFAPTLVIMYLLDFLAFKQKTVKDSLMEATLLIPSGLFFLCQFFYNFLAPGNSSGGIVLSFFDSWRCYTNNVLLSILAIITYPIYICLFCEKKLLKNKQLLYAIIFYFISLAEYGLLAETGERLAHGNFGWGYSLAIGIVFLSSIITFVRYIRSRAEEKAWIYYAKIVGGCSLLLVHFCRGVWYYLQLLLYRDVQLF